MIDYMPSKNASETIEILSRKLERIRILNDLMSCTNYDDIQEYIQLLEQQVANDKRQ